MNQETQNAIIAANEKAQYDTYAKRLLSQKIILAHILAKTVDEFKGMDPEIVATYIEGEPKLGMTPIDSGLTNSQNLKNASPRLKGLNTEDAEINEGTIRFDIIFYVRMKNGLSQIIVNIEIQKNEPSSYQILNRAIFYVSRLISSQKERDFSNSNYDDIKQVFSIWICMNMDFNSMSHIHLTKDDLLEPYHWKGNLNILNIILLGITNEPPKHNENFELHRLISTLLSNRLNTSEKLKIIKEEYHIPLRDNSGEDVNIMCNLGQGIEDNAIEKIILNMYKNKFNLEQISLATERNIEEIKKIIIKNKSASV